MASLTQKKIQNFLITTLFFSSLLTLSLAVDTVHYHAGPHHRRGSPSSSEYNKHRHRHRHRQGSSIPTLSNNKNERRHVSPTWLDKQEFLREHNKLRKAMGEEPYQWDKNLARYARRFANQRAEDCQMIHSTGPYGENIYWGQDYDRHSAADAVQAWASEVTDYDASSNTCALDKMCGHYTQMIWKASQRLGCARVKCKDGGTYIICSYDPPGNYVGETPLGNNIPWSDGDATPSSSSPSTPSSSSPFPSDTS